MEIGGQRWKPASRWWEKNRTGKQMEIDVVAESMDGSKILFGEVKWEKKSNIIQIMDKLLNHAENFPKIGKREIVLAAWCKHAVNSPGNIHVYNADEVLNAVRS